MRRAKAVCPAAPHGAKGLLISAIRDDTPVVFREHRMLYGGNGPRKESISVTLSAEIPESDYEISLGTALNVRPGKDVTIMESMLTLYRALSAAEMLADKGIEVEVIDVRCLLPLDVDTLKKLAKTPDAC